MTKNNIDPEAEFPKVEKLLYSLAWEFCKKYPIEFEDAKSEAYAGFMKACNNFRPNKGTKFSSWCRLVVWGYLQSHIMERSQDKLVFMEINENMLGHETPHAALTKRKAYEDAITKLFAPSEPVLVELLLDSPAEVTELCEDLSEDAKEMLFLLMDAPRLQKSRPFPEPICPNKTRRWIHAARKELRLKLTQFWAVVETV